ncbi:MAG: hypothetical protein QOJ27_1142, partial [Sphingomonadales bacterium]|nr:hypothetical protein [Sphingomonadales bacterium]
YAKEADLIVPFLSPDYVGREWPTTEWRVIRDLLKSGQGDRIMPVKLAAADLAGLHSIDGYLDAAEMDPEQVADLILERLAAG